MKHADMPRKQREAMAAVRAAARLLDIPVSRFYTLVALAVRIVVAAPGGPGWAAGPGKEQAKAKGRGSRKSTRPARARRT